MQLFFCATLPMAPLSRLSEVKSMSDPILEIRNLNLRVANTPLLNDLNLNVHAGAFHVILGPSGCGKTTLLKCICGFMRIGMGILF